MNNFEKIMAIVLKDDCFNGKSEDFSLELPMLFIQDEKVYMALIVTFDENDVGVVTFCFQDGTVKYYTKEEFVAYKVVSISEEDKQNIDKTYIEYTEEELVNEFSQIVDKYINYKQLDTEAYNNYLDKVIKSTQDEYGKIYISKFRI